MISPTIKFIVPGKIRGKGRPRVCRRKNSNGVVTYTPDTTLEYESLIQFQYIGVQKENIIQDKPFVITVEMFYEIPKSYTKKKRQDCLSGVIQPTKKPDIDNVLKIVLDALNGIAYNDDAQCVGVAMGKNWSKGQEYLEVCLKWGE